MNRLIVILLMLVAMPAQAEPEALVQAVQMPAWLHRDANITPLRVGTTLHNGDKLVTGSNARIYVQTADGSTVKLGESAALTLTGLSAARAPDSVFSAVLNVGKGAFRFTTGALAKLKGRNITVKVASATLGIRGTDVWGKDGDEQGVVCLIEGKIEVTGADNQPFVMDQPLSFYKMPKGAEPLPVAPVDPEQLKKWAVETDIAQPAAQLGGKWKVNLMTAQDRQSALAAYDLWREAGYDVRLLPTGLAGVEAYTLRIVQIPSRGEAEKLAKLLQGKLGAENPAVSR